MTFKSTDWEEVPLQRVLTYLDDRVELDDAEEYVTITVKRRHGGLEEREKLFGHQIKTKKQFRLVPGAFIISRVQCWHQAYAVVPNNLPSNIIASINYDQFTISPDVSHRFFWWLTHSPRFTETVRSSAVGVVIEKMVFDRDAWLEKTVSLPPLGEQQRIVARIEEVAAKINDARTLRINAANEAASIIRTAVTRIDRDVRSKHSVAMLENFASGERGAIRSGPFGSALLHSEFVVEGIPAIGIQDVQENRFELTRRWNVTPEKAKELRRYTVKPRDILVTVMGTLGRACVVPDDIPRMVSTKHVWTVTLDQTRAEPKWVSYWLNFSSLVRDELLGQGTGTAIPGLNGEKIRALSLPDIPLLDQQNIVAKLDALQAQVDALKKLQAETTIELGALLPSILDKAFKGEL